MEPHLIESIDLELALLIRHLTSLKTSRTSPNLDRSAYLLLQYIHNHESVGVKTLADALRLDVSTASRQAAALEQKGYVFRTPDPQDGRAYFLKLTDLGREDFFAYKVFRQTRILEITEGWPDEDRAKFGELLHKFNQGLR
ncbi:MarR family winged helix-turn-helix transcriptional regulator [Gorillibacterium massiliense]|uniref:MarR family winged helix-turn-helix transcriptional regulator n=1 Tax=Gorillibacterium massiliense TaxID=1280390 RepID=UPI0004B6D796|nr:MarR family transcriptional regulator [Gorillibacterium massiliense]